MGGQHDISLIVRLFPAVLRRRRLVTRGIDEAGAITIVGHIDGAVFDDG